MSLSVGREAGCMVPVSVLASSSIEPKGATLLLFKIAAGDMCQLLSPYLETGLRASPAIFAATFAQLTTQIWSVQASQ